VNNNAFKINDFSAILYVAAGVAMMQTLYYTHLVISSGVPTLFVATYSRDLLIPDSEISDKLE